jgi:hypothetical protein
MKILFSLLAMYAHDLKPWHGGLRPGRRKRKSRQMLEGYYMLYADYFADDPLHNNVKFWRRFRMNWKRFMKIVLVVREYETYFVSKQDRVGTTGCSLI